MAGENQRPLRGRETNTPCRQGLCGSFIEIKGVGEGRKKEKYREEAEEEARTSLPLQKSSGKREMGWAGLLS